MPSASSSPSERRAAPMVVYGATGHTGRFVCAELVRRRVPLAISGRSPHQLRELAGAIGTVDVRPASIDDHASLAAAFAGASAVINCAGPFLDTAATVCKAALDAGAHYLDITAEQAAAAGCFESFAGAARQRGVAVVPAAAFYGGLADLLATATMGDWTTADRIDIAIALDHWHPTAGTRLTGKRNTATRVNVAGGVLAPLVQSAHPRTWTFGAPFGDEPVVELPFSEMITITRHLRATEVHTFLTRSSLDDIRNPDTPPPRIDPVTGYSAQQFRMEVVARRDGAVRRSAASGRDIYAVSAPIVVEAAVRLAGARDRHAGGAFALGERFDAADFLRALAPRHVHVEIPTTAGGHGTRD
jgi:uncharacterized protein YbjT (DUF2867 family)